MENIDHFFKFIEKFPDLAETPLEDDIYGFYEKCYKQQLNIRNLLK